eukprot:m.448629 g.448629  ORF g.448629 m.448629 type:complete len:577 (-) comp19688_c0_seq1:1630-3360(-)
MFYHEFVLAKKGTLGKVWLAAHWEKKLSRSAIAKHDVVNSCKSIIEPVTPLALRTSGHLLLGVVRIHDGKAKDLMTDCSNALCQIKRAYTPGLDSTSKSTTVTQSAITLDKDQVDADELPEYIDAEDSAFAGQANLGRAEEITMPAENDFMEADYAAPDMAEAFGDEFPAEVPFYDEQEEQFGEIEQGRNLPDRSLDISAVEHLDDTTNDPTLDPTLDQTVDQEEPFRAPDFGEEFPLDTTLDGTTRADAFEEEYEPTFANESRADEERVENITLDSLEPTVSKTAAAKASSSFSLGRKRKLIIDANTEISSDDMKEGLAPEGPNDITRQPYSPDRQVLAFSRPAPTRAALRRQLRDSSIEARFSRPLTLGGRWKGKALQAWEHGLKTTLSLPQAPEIADEDEIELGRHNVLDDSTYQPPDEVPMPEEMPPVEFEEMPMPFEAEQNPIDETVDEPSRAGSAVLGNDTTMGSDFAEDPSVLHSRVEEELEEEQITSTEFGEDHLTSRTKKMIESLQKGFEDSKTGALSYNKMTQKKSRRTAAACLFELLVLKTKDYIDIEQDSPFGDLTITAAAQME